MLICPKCGYEYREGFETCAGCGEKLVVVDENKERVEKKVSEDQLPEAMDAVLLAERVEAIETDIIAGLLENQGICVLIRDIGMGGYLKITMGNTYYGKNIFVDKKDFEHAREILEMYRSGSCEIDNETDASPDESKFDTQEFQDESGKDSYDRFFGFGRRVVKTIIVILLILSMLSAILNYIIVPTIR